MGYDGTLKFDTSIATEGFQSGISKISSIAGKGLKATGAIIAGAGTAIVGLGTAAIKVGADFESGMSKVKAISNASGEEMAKLTEKAKEMGAKTKFSAGESAEAFQYMAMAGWKTADMLDGIEGIMNLAAASGENLATTSDIVTDALTAFGMSASDSGRFADVLAAASSNANTNVAMMGETFKYVAPVAGALGFSAEDCATAIGLMANSGIKAGQAGTSLRAIMTRMAKPTKEVQAAMDELGICITNSDGSMKDLNSIMRDLRKGFNGLTQEQKAQMAAAIGGQEAMSGLLAIVGASDEDFEKLTESIYNSDGAAQRMAETMMDNLPGAIEQAGGALETLGLTFYEHVQEPAKDVVNTVTEMIDEMNTSFTENGFEGLVQSFGENLAKLSQMAMESAPKLVESATNLVTSFIDGIRVHAFEFSEAGVELITSLAIGFLSCTAEIWSAAITIATQIVEGLAQNAPMIVQAGIDCVSKLAEAIISSAPTLLESGVKIVFALVQGIAQQVPAIFQAGIDLLGNLANGIRENLPNLIPVAMEALMNFSGTLRENVGQLVDAGLDLIMALADSLIDNIPVFIETVPTIITNLAGIINDNAPKLLGCGIELLAKLAMGLIEAIPTLIANIPQIIQAIVSAFFAFNWVSIGSKIITFIKDGITSLASAIPDAIKNIGTTARDFLHGIDWHNLGANIINFIVNGIQSLVTSIPTLLQSIGTTAVEWFKGIDWVGLGINLVEGIIGGITGALDGLWTTIGNLCTGLLDKIKGFFGIHSPSTVMEEQGNFMVEGVILGLQDLPSKAADLFEQTLQRAIQWGTNMVSNCKKAASDTLSNVCGFISQLPGKIAGFLTNALNNARTWGSNLVSNMKNTASNAVNGVISFISQLPGKVMSKLSNVASKVASWGSNLVSSFRNIGRNVIQGLINGIGSMVSSLYSSIKKSLSGLVNKAKSALGIHSPSKVFANEIGKWIPPGIGEGIKAEMPELTKETQAEMGNLTKKMKAAVAIETGTIKIKKQTSENYKLEKENGQSFDGNKTEVNISGDTHVHVDLDGEEIGHATVPTVDKDMARIDTHKKRGG